MNNFVFGWLRDYHDHRDHQLDDGHPLISKAIGSDYALGLIDNNQVAELTNLPSKFDLRNGFSPIELQGDLQSCTAHVVTSIVEYLHQKAHGEKISCSRLFLYKTTRNLMKVKGNYPVFMRNTIAALAFFGAPPEDYWPYELGKYDDEPTSFCYAFASNYKALMYTRLDPPSVKPDALLQAIKMQIVAGFPLAFGTSLTDGALACSKMSESAGQFPYPHSSDKVKGGHALVAVGYDDSKVIKNPKSDEPTTGAILIRNSWGTSWGEEGYGWLPYTYIQCGVAVDWWAILSESWVDTGMFGLKDSLT